MKIAVALTALSLAIVTSLPVYAQLQDESSVGVGAQLDNPESSVAIAPVIDIGGEPAAAAVAGRVGGGMKALNLTDEQLEKIHDMKNKLADTLGPKRLELQSAQRQLKDMITKPTLDRKAITQTQDKINGLRADIANLSLAFKMDVSEQLTDDQKKQIRRRALSPKHARKGHRKAHGARGNKGARVGESQEQNTVEVKPNA